MAPEQIGGGVVDARTDVYALGCCAYQMLTGAPFARGDTVFAILAGHLDDARPRIGAAHGVPKAVADVVHRCLARDPDDRFASARELEAALCEAQLAAGLPDLAEHLEPPDVDEPRRGRIANALARSRRRVRVRSAVLAAAIALVVLLVGGGGWLRASMVAEAADREEVGGVVVAARDAAAHSRFVYPSPRPDAPTAYQHVIRLERWDGPARSHAQAQAQALRAELGRVLLELGDDAWARPGGQGAARDWYTQALVLDPSLTRARDRVGLTPDELAALQHEAGIDAFTPVELETAAQRGPSEAEGKPAAPPTGVERATRGSSRGRTRVRPTDVRGQPTRGEPTTVVAPAASPRRDPARARALVRAAKRAERFGKRARAKQLYESALLADDRNVDAYAGLADACFEEGEHERALRYARIAARREPHVARHRLRLGDSYYRVARHDEALAEYRKAAELGSRQARRRLEQLARR
jgi:tetratricopeptide (TPR) repeat protein